MTEAMAGSRESVHAQPRGAPLLLRLSRAIERRGWRGGTALLRLAHRVGVLDRPARYALGRDIELDVPLHLRPMDEDDVRAYESVLVERLATAIDAMAAPTTLIDCGADFGLISLKLVARCARITRVIAVEPNSATRAALTSNMARLPCTASSELAAAGDTCGRGELRYPAHDPESEVSRFVVPSAAGDFPVITVDALAADVRGCVALKCDVEGSERAVVRGAVETLRRASRFVVAFEAHPDHVQRTGIDPMAIVADLRAIRACTAVVAETGLELSDEHTALFTELSERRIVNVVCASVAGPAGDERAR
ncbi:MAG TPA: FkbM family methyltransferase [Gemmatimonadaceae bacterium]|nr:FkbM family methyltransferase [Gemmatimonadaceae bacterium]